MTGRKKSRKSPKSLIKYKAEIADEEEDFIEDEGDELVDEETELDTENQF